VENVTTHVYKVVQSHKLRKITIGPSSDYFLVKL